jgi:membrane-associated phospholipid phosphatase
MPRFATVALVVSLGLPLTALAQDKVTDQAAPAAAPRTDPAPEPGGFKRFMTDVGHDYRDFLSLDNAQWAAIGGLVTGALAPLDDQLADDLAAPTPYALKPGQTYGNASLQFPIAIAWWVAGHAAGSSRHADAGRDLLRAQISATSWTYAIKYSVNRTRPNGDPRSFPSGHASATFATAMVLERHYGWKLGVPAFAAAAYTGAERVTNNKHWLSDVAFGAVVGMLSGRTVTLHLYRADLDVQPVAVPGGAGVMVHVVR